MQFLEDARKAAFADMLAGLSEEEMRRGGLRPQDVSRMLELARSSAPAFARDCFDPGHFTASAFVVSPDRKCMLLIFHEKLRLWLQPGGHVEATDRDLVAAALREVREETLLEAVDVESPVFDLDIHRIPSIAGLPEHLHFDVRSVFSARDWEVATGDGVTDCRWFDMREVVESPDSLGGGGSTDESVRRVAERLLAGRAHGQPL